jgi:hypothetical protein
VKAGRAWVLAILSITLSAGSAWAQPAPGGYRAPLASDGHPDLQGNWTNASLTPLERPPQLSQRRAFSEEDAALIEERARGLTTSLEGDFTANLADRAKRLMRVAGEARTSLITSPPNGRISTMTAQAQARPPLPWNRPASPDMFDNPETLSPDLRCIMPFAMVSGPVMQPALANSVYQIVQTRDAVAIVSEMFHDVRIVRIGAAHGPTELHPWMGDSVGRWEGEVLVVETTSFHPLQNLFGASAADLKVIERFSRVGPDRLLYQFRVEDPTTWTQAWGGEYEFGPAGPLYEYACHEGERTLVDLLARARLEDARAVAARP